MSTQEHKEDRLSGKQGKGLHHPGELGEYEPWEGTHIFKHGSHYKMMSPEGREGVIGNHMLPLPGSAPVYFISPCGKG